MTAKTCWTCGASILPGDAEARDEGRLASDAKKAAEEMRERAAKEAEICGSTRAAERIRALPVE